MMENKLGKISKVSFGFGGYQEAQFGISFVLGGESWGVGDFWGMWASRTTGAKWSVEDQKESFGDMCLKIIDLLKLAKVDSVDKLKGTPVEVEFEGNCLKSWRVLKEVI